MTVGLDENQASPAATVNQMVQGHTTMDMAGTGDHLATDLEATWASLELTGVLTGTRTLSMHDTITNKWVVTNNTTGAYTLTVQTVSGAGVEVPQGSTLQLFSDGTDVFNVGIAAGTIDGLELKNYVDTSSAPASVSNTLTLDVSNGNVFDVTLTEDVTTLAFSGVNTAASTATRVTLMLTQDGVGSRLMTWPAAIKWAGGTSQTLTTAIGAVDIFELVTMDQGTSWHVTAYSIDSK